MVWVEKDRRKRNKKTDVSVSSVGWEERTSSSLIIAYVNHGRWNLQI